MGFFIGLMIIALGASIIHYRFQIFEFTGEWNWANTYLGNTVFAIVIIGMIVVGAGAAYPFGIFDGHNKGTVVTQEMTTPSK